MENMLGKLLERIVLLSLEALGPMHDLVERLLGENRVWWLCALKKFLRKENPFIADESFFETKEMWKKIYKKHFRSKVDFSSLQIPECPGHVADYWLVIVAKGMTPEKIFLACKKTFGAWKWTEKNLDDVARSVRNSGAGSYAIWVRSSVEADEEFKNLSANELEKRGHKGITSEERMLLEIMYFEQTSKHLDINNVTLCTGSRYDDGNVPRVFWLGDGLSVRWDYPDDSSGNLRSRVVVS
jgi:hypothetical protein